MKRNKSSEKFKPRSIGRIAASTDRGRLVELDDEFIDGLVKELRRSQLNGSELKRLLHYVGEERLRSLLK